MPHRTPLADPILAAFFRASGAALGVGDAVTARILDVNDRMLELLGYAREELIGRTAFELNIWVDPAVRQDLLPRLLAERELRDVEMRIRRKDGSQRDVLTTMTILALPDGTEVNLLTMVDISARRRAEEALRRSEARFRAMIESAPIGIFLSDPSGRNLFVNAVHARSLGLAREDALQRGWLAAVHPDDRDAVQATLDAPAAGDAPLDRHMRFRHADGSVVEVSVRSLPLLEDGAVAGWVGFSEDITERRQAERGLREKQRVEAVGHLAGGIAHDFNNLLTVILASAALAEGELPPDAPALEPIHDIAGAARRAAALTRQLLAFARRQVVEPRVVDLNALVLNLDKMLRRLIGEHIELVTLPADRTVPVLADPGQIEQVLLNLAVNARDAMPRGGTLTIEVGTRVFPEGAPPAPDLPHGVYASLTVRDTGSGMAPDVLERAFEPFFTTKAPGEGTGLGLATVHSIVHHAGGHITLSSGTTGTTATVYLPRARASGTGTALPRSDALPRGTETILLVEDEPTVRGVAERILAAHGYRVLTAQNGSEGLRVAREAGAAVDMVLSDVVMPQMGGVDMVLALRQERPDLRVLLTSGYVELPVIEQVLHDPHTAFLPKPYQLTELLGRVREVLDRT